MTRCFVPKTSPSESFDFIEVGGLCQPFIAAYMDAVGYCIEANPLFLDAETANSQVSDFPHCASMVWE